MNILFISSIFPDASHASRGTFNFELCSALQRDGADVKVIAPQAWTEVVKSKFKGAKPVATEQIQNQNLEVHYPTYWYPPKVLRSQYGQFYWNSVESTVYKILKNWTPDFILSYWAHPDGEAGVRISDITGAPCAVIVGGSDVLIIPNSPARKKAVVDALTHSDAVITISDGLNEAVQNLGVEKEDAVTIYQGVDTNRFVPENKPDARNWLGLDAKRPLLLWVGRMVSVKNLDLLIRTCELKASRGDDFVLCLIGDGPLCSQYKKMVKEKGLDDMISFVGTVSHEDLPSWYQAADVTVLCSHSEGLPNVFRESLACGTPFVSTDVGSISEIADASYSILTQPGSEAGLLTAIDAVLYGNQQEGAAKTDVRSWDDMAKQVVDLAHNLKLEATVQPENAGESLPHEAPAEIKSDA